MERIRNCLKQAREKTFYVRLTGVPHSRAVVKKVLFTIVLVTQGSPKLPRGRGDDFLLSQSWKGKRCLASFVGTGSPLTPPDHQFFPAAQYLEASVPPPRPHPSAPNRHPHPLQPSLIAPSWGPPGDAHLHHPSLPPGTSFPKRAYLSYQLPLLSAPFSASNPLPSQTPALHGW